MKNKPPCSHPSVSWVAFWGLVSFNSNIASHCMDVPNPYTNSLWCFNRLFAMLLPTRVYIPCQSYQLLITLNFFFSNMVPHIAQMHHNSFIHFPTDENLGLNTKYLPCS